MNWTQALFHYTKKVCCGKVEFFLSSVSFIEPQLTKLDNTGLFLY